MSVSMYELFCSYNFLVSHVQVTTQYQWLLAVQLLQVSSEVRVPLLSMII